MKKAKWLCAAAAALAVSTALLAGCGGGVYVADFGVFCGHRVGAHCL